MRNTSRVVESWLEAVEVSGQGLTKWEQDFIESIREQFDNSLSLSDTQERILERIYSEKTP